MLEDVLDAMTISIFLSIIVIIGAATYSKLRLQREKEVLLFKRQDQ